MTKLILVGGFLGSGKTTLLKKVAHRLSHRGRCVGVIVNDQAPGLVDTAILSGCPCGVKEVAGSCFCCDYHAFEAACQSLIDEGAEIILAEPVGSCTDLAATILQPLKERARISTSLRSRCWSAPITYARPWERANRNCTSTPYTS